MTPNVRRFIAHVEATCKKHKVRFLLAKGKTVDQGDGLGCSGFFDDEDMVLAVACGHKDWLGILAHEFCHMLQWIADDPLWINSGEKMCEWYWEWVFGSTERSKDKTDRACRAQLAVELGCEQRAVRLMRRWKLPVNLDRYIRNANAYVMFYTFMRLNGVWYGRAPYRVPAIRAIMPGKFMPRGWYEKMSPEYAQLVYRHCLTPSKQRRAWSRLVKAA